MNTHFENLGIDFLMISWEFNQSVNLRSGMTTCVNGQRGDTQQQRLT